MKKIVWLVLWTCVVNPKVIVIGHRGAAGTVAENTIASCEYAIVHGADMVECDVWCCASGEVVVMHDRLVDRTTNGLGSVKNLTLQELKDLSIDGAHTVPTLNELLDCINRRVIVNIEIKDPDALRPVLELMQQYVRFHHWHYDDFLLSSFDHRLLLKAKQVIPELMTGAIFYGVPIDLAAGAQKVDADIVIIDQDHMDEFFIRDAQTRNMDVFVYTINDIWWYNKAIEYHVDGIITDYPEIIKQYSVIGDNRSIRQMIVSDFYILVDALNAHMRDLIAQSTKGAVYELLQQLFELV